ncbi:MAG: sugar phosphate isomerase/epimerase family protein [Terriglobia bacterium]
MNKHLSRREFLSSGTAFAAAVPVLAGGKAAAPAAVQGPFRGTLCMFSKPVPQLNWRELGRAIKNAGFGGVDLTVRRQGHVLPERAATDLPKAVADIRDAGIEVPMITTELLSADDPTAEPIMSTASKLSIPYVKPGYYHYLKPGYYGTKFLNYPYIDVLKEVNEAGEKFRGLVALAAKHKIQVGYHNHPYYIGAPIWDMFRVIEPLDPRWCGFYYDLSSATMEGGVSGWKISADLVMPRLKMVAAKDFTWKKVAPHQWRAELCPVGQGMSHWKTFLQTLARSNFHGPISLQQEQTIPGVTGDQGIALSRAAVPAVMAAIKANLDSLKSLVHEAYELV